MKKTLKTLLLALLVILLPNIAQGQNKNLTDGCLGQVSIYHDVDQVQAFSAVVLPTECEEGAYFLTVGETEDENAAVANGKLEQGTLVIETTYLLRPPLTAHVILVNYEVKPLDENNAQPTRLSR